MILNETYDTILERLNNKYGIVNEGLFNRKEKQKYIYLELKEKYDKYIKNPFTIDENEDEFLLNIVKWNMNTDQFIDIFTKTNKIENIKSSSEGIIADEILNKLQCNGLGWFVERNGNNDVCIFILKNRKMYITNYDEINQFALDSLNDSFYYKGIKIKKDDYFKYTK